MAAESGQKFDHVVSVMFENRTFDNLLGRLYQPGEVASFEGVLGKQLTNPIPDWAVHGADRKAVPYGVAAGMHVPDPDAGEDFQHVNTQLFGVIDPPGNRCVLPELMTAPFNAPADPEAVPTMDGFVADYISTLRSMPCSAQSGIGLVSSLPSTPSNEATSPGWYSLPSRLSKVRFSNITETT
jgi:phospholipase C